MKCKYCEKELQPLNPPVEDYLENKFCINIFGWKLILLKDSIEYGCPDCIIDEQKSRENDGFREACFDYVNSEIEKGNLISKTN